MKVIFTLLVGSVFAIGCAPKSKLVAISNEPTGILGGTNVSANDPLTQNLVGVYNGGGYCTGTLVSNHVVLTAAHCVFGKSVSSMHLSFGLDLNSNPIIVPVDTLEISPKWNIDRNKDLGDLALLQFSQQAPKGYKAASFLKDPAEIRNGQLVTLAGYGVTDDVYAEGFGILRSTTIQIKDAQWADSEVELDQTQGHGACKGDSGGPAFIIRSGVNYLWGVTSRGEGLHNGHYVCSQYSIYTNVLPSMEWIQRTINKFD